MSTCEYITQLVTHYCINRMGFYMYFIIIIIIPVGFISLQMSCHYVDVTKKNPQKKPHENPSISWRHKSFNFAHTDDYRCLLLNDTMERFSPLLALCEVLCKLSQMIKWPVMRADFETSC